MSPKNAESKSGSGRSQLKQFYWILGAVAVLGIGWIGYSAMGAQSAMGASRPVDLSGMGQRELAEAAVGIRQGPEDAAITIWEFGDFQCPACAEFAALYKPAIARDLVSTGRAAFVFRDFPLAGHPNSFIAARSARCANDQGLFWEYHDQLFGAQSRWGPMADPTGVFVDVAQSVGANEGTFKECLSGDAHAETVSANLALAVALGAGGTPAIFIQRGAGTPQALMSFDYSTILAAVEEAERAAAGG